MPGERDWYHIDAKSALGISANYVESADELNSVLKLLVNHCERLYSPLRSANH